MQDEARRRKQPVPLKVPADAKLFQVPGDLCGVLTQDLKAAGIPAVDERGFVLDVHALRHTFASMLAKGGVAPRVTQELMRHSDPRQTNSVYTHLQLHDTKGALDVLPDLTLNVPASARAVGAELLPPTLPLPTGQSGQNGTFPGMTASMNNSRNSHSSGDATAYADKSKRPLTTEVISGRLPLVCPNLVPRLGLEPKTR